MKTKDELNAIRNEIEALREKLKPLSEDELKAVTGGGDTYKMEKSNPTDNTENASDSKTYGA